MLAINVNSKNPERAMMVLNEFYTNPEINDMTRFGIEGKHWEAVGDNALVSLPDSVNYPYDGNCNWGVRNDATWRVVEGGIPNLSELNAIWQETARSSRYQTFVFDDSEVKNEIAAMGEIFNNEYKLLGLEQLTRIKERWFREALRQRLRAYAAFLACRGEAILDPEMVRMVFTRALPVNELETAQTLNALSGILPGEELEKRAMNMAGNR